MILWREFVWFVANLSGAIGGLLLIAVALMQVITDYGIGGAILTLFALSFTLSVAARVLERRGR